jgi:sugar phosphate isomerase/epimerase
VHTGPLILAAGSMLDHPAEVVLEAAAEAGFDGVGLRLSVEHAVSDPARLGSRAASLGLTVHDVEVYRIDGSATNPEPLLDAAAAAGAAALLVVSDLADRSATLDALATLHSECDARGLRLGLEYMAWTDPSDPLAAIDVAAATGCQLVVDLLHHVRVGAGAAELDAIVASGRLGWVQVCDAPPAAPPGRDALIHEARHGRLVPGAGGLDLTPLLARIPGDVAISVEVQSDALLTEPAGERAQRLHDAARAVLGHPSSTG